jgi:predicted DNA-binding antitoxin AbrB/MazE fold protein
MSYITIPATYSNGVVTPLEEINVEPISTTITFEYKEEIPNLLNLLKEAEQSKEVFKTHKELMNHLNN